jgi:hypothetical protein
MDGKSQLWLSVASVLFFTTAPCVATGAPAPKVLFSPAPGTSGTAVTSVVTSLYPENSLECMAIGDIVAANLLQAGIKVVSNETVIRTRQRLLRQVEAQLEEERKAKGVADANGIGKPNTSKQPEPVKKQDLPFLDSLAIAKEAGADCLVRVNVVVQTIQQNIYDAEGRRVTEVRTQNRVSLITASIVGTNGGVLKAGSVSFADPATVAIAADGFGKALVGELKPR